MYRRARVYRTARMYRTVLVRRKALMLRRAQVYRTVGCRTYRGTYARRTWKGLLLTALLAQFHRLPYRIQVAVEDPEGDGCCRWRSPPPLPWWSDSASAFWSTVSCSP